MGLAKVHLTALYKYVVLTWLPMGFLHLGLFINYVTLKGGEGGQCDDVEYITAWDNV